MTKFNRIALFGLALAVLTLPVEAQTNTLTATTTTAAVATSDSVIAVTSATGITAPNLLTGTVGSQLYVQSPGSKGEVMRVLGVSGLNITVARSNNAPQVSGALVLAGNPNWFYSSDPFGGCTTASTYVTPWVNTNSGLQWLCSTISLSWVPGFNNDSQPAVPTAAVASAAGLITPSGLLFHVTGALAITGFNVPVGFSSGQFCIIPDGAYTTTATNNVALATTGVVSKPQCWTYDPGAAKFYPSY